MSRARRRAGRSAKRRPRRDGVERAIVRDWHRLMAYPGVRSVAVGVKEKANRLTARLCVKVYVSEKRSPADLGPERLPRTAVLLWPEGRARYRVKRVPLDVVECDRLDLLAGPRDLRPQVMVGDEVGIAGALPIGAGTHACVVRRSADGVALLMTAAHVVTSQPGRVTPGLSVFQPSVPSPAREIGPVVDGFQGNMPSIGAYIDAALYRLSNPSRSAVNQSWHAGLSSVVGAWSLADIRNRRLAMRKVGAVTGDTVGAYSAFHTAFVDPVRGPMLSGLEFVGPPGLRLVEEGDSGSAAVDTLSPATGALIGMVVAASPDRSRAYVVPFETMKAAFGLDAP